MGRSCRTETITKEKSRIEPRGFFVEPTAADLWDIAHFGDPNVRYARLVHGSPERHRSLIENLLIHDTIHIPTQDYLALAGLIGRFGEKVIRELLDAEVIRFVRVKGSLAYIGNGGGLSAFTVASPNGQARVPYANLDAAIDWALSGLNVSLDKRAMTKEAAKVSREFDLKDVQAAVRHETYRDAFYLAPDIADSFRRFDLDRLPGIPPADVRIYGGPEERNAGDLIETLLTTAHANLELRCAEIAACNDIRTDTPMQEVLHAKEAQVGKAYLPHGSLAVLREIAGVPDVPDMVAHDFVELRALLKLRDSADGRAFRQWFHENCRGSPLETARAYADLLKTVPKISSAQVDNSSFGDKCHRLCSWTGIQSWSEAR